MDGHESHAVGALLLDQVEEHLLVELVRIAVAAAGFAKGLVERNIAHRQVDGGDHLAPHPVEVAAHGELHQGVGAGILGGLRLAHFGLDIDDVRGGADGGVDLGAEPLADAHNAGGTICIQRGYDLTFRKALADEFRLQPFLRGDLLHLWC